jgi:glycosyltransferase involved in cell wall biosynthesis
MKLSVVIPVYNERSTIEEVIDKVRSVDIPKEIIVVDDGSTDGTPEILKRKEKELNKVLISKRNFGKGSAVRTGLGFATGDIAIIQDADLELDPNEYHDLIKPIVDGKASVVYGSRFRKKVKGLTFMQLVGNKFLIFLTNLLYGTNLTDMETAYKVFSLEAIRRINLKCTDFGFEAEVTAKLAKVGYKIYEVPISYHPRSAKEGKKIRWKDGFKAISYLIKYKFTD